jgi:hypothetical protein
MGKIGLIIKTELNTLAALDEISRYEVEQAQVTIVQ